MKDVQIDVELAIPQGEIVDAVSSTFGKNVLAKDIIDRVRQRADDEAHRVGGRLHTDRIPEFYIRRGSDVIHGGDFLLVASRWWVSVPNAFDPARAAAASR